MRRGDIRMPMGYRVDSAWEIEFIVAARWGELDNVKRMVEIDPDIMGTEAGEGALYDSMSGGHREVMAYLLDHGADVNKALNYASSCGQLDTVSYLLGRGAGINATDDYGQTAIWRACSEDQLPMVKFLHSQGADPTMTDPIVINSGGHNPLTIASYHGYIDMVEYLLTIKQVRQTIDHATGSGSTALMLACHKHHPHVVKLLVNAGADVMKTDWEGQAPKQALSRKLSDSVNGTHVPEADRVKMTECIKILEVSQ